ncbi:MAG: response regulator [Polyangiaceae bacterium]|nr:response regulator [Polyangiaceae bacterium]
MTVPPDSTVETEEQKPTLLIVDDRLDNVQLLAGMLTSEGFETLIARDGQSALEKAAYAKPDLILLDVLMPGLDGFETCRRLKASDATRDIPVIFLTALSELEPKLAGFEAGAVDYITKPLEMTEVLARVRVHLALRSMQRQLAEQNAQLAREIAVRQQVEDALRLAHEQLERRVQARTAELASANVVLEAEVVRRRRAQADLQQRNRELALLNRVIGASGAERRSTSMLAMTCRELVDAFDLDQATAAVLDASRAEVTVIASHHRGGPPRLLGEVVRLADNPAARLVFQDQASLAVLDVAGDPRLASVSDRLQRAGITSLLAVPVVFDGKAVAALLLGSVRPREFSDPDVKLAECVAQQVAGVLARLRLNEERRQLEEQYHHAQKMEALGRLTGSVAHDFNNILTVIMGNSEVVLSHLRGDDRFRGEMEQIRQAADRAASLTRQLLTFSRHQVRELQVLDVNDVLKAMGGMLRTLVGEDIDLQLVVDAAPAHVKVDNGQLEQVIMNLVVNARDAMPEGGRLTLEARNVYLSDAYAHQHADVSSGPYVLIAVSDTGAGMTAETRAKAFEPFFTTKQKGKGTGLGLATVHGIVAQSGGHVWLYSELDQGTTVKVYLPSAPAESEQAMPSVPAIAGRGGTESILLVEDEQMLRDLACRVLAREGYTVTAAGSASEALTLVSSEGPVDLLLTDVVVPGGANGVELANQLRITCPKLRVLYMSGYTDNAVVHHGILAPGAFFLQKPFTPLELTLKVREVLDGEPAPPVEPET